MEINQIKSFFSTFYVLPTQESVGKYLDENSRPISKKKQNLQGFGSLPTLKKVTVSHHPLIYPSPTLSKVVLSNNCKIHKKIAELLKLDRYEKFNNQIKVAENIFQKVNKMPRIKKLNLTKPDEAEKKDDSLILSNNPTQNVSKKMPQITKYEAKPIPMNIPHFDVAWNSYEIHSWNPEIREGATLSNVSGKFYLFGGLSRQLFNQISVLVKDIPITKSLDKENKFCFYSWSNIDFSHLHPDALPKARYGHTANVFQKDIVIFGGTRMFNKSTKARECMNDLQVFHTENNQWEEIKYSGAVLEPRRNHTSCIVGKHLIIHGGIDEHGVFFNELIAIHLPIQNKISQGLKWAFIQTKGEKLGKIAYHSCCLVLSQEKLNDPNIGLYYIPETVIPLKYFMKEQPILEGIYFYGGKDENGNLTNKISVLKIGKTTPEWIYPDVSGMAPIPRYGHSMNYFPELKIIVIFGGRNDKNFSLAKSYNLNEIGILSVSDHLGWTTVQVNGKIPIPRYSHCSVVNSNELIIFGGLSDITFCTSELFILNLNQNQQSDYKLNEQSKLIPSISRNSFQSKLGYKI